MKKSRVAVLGAVAVFGAATIAYSVHRNRSYTSVTTSSTPLVSASNPLRKQELESKDFIIYSDDLWEKTPGGINVRPKVYFDLEIQGCDYGRVEFTLYNDIAPKTAYNFYSLCKGNLHPMLNYRNSTIHRILPSMLIQGGDIVRRNGTGGVSIYGGTYEHENHILKHNKVGLLTTVSRVDRCNGSQYVVLTTPSPWFDGSETVFGEVSKGMDVLRRLERLALPDGRIEGIVRIKECGEVLPQNTSIQNI